MPSRPRTLAHLNSELYAATTTLARLTSWLRAIGPIARLSPRRAERAEERLGAEIEEARCRLASVGRERARALRHVYLLADALVWAARHGRSDTERWLEARLLTLLGGAAFELPADHALAAEEERYVRACLWAEEAPSERAPAAVMGWLMAREAVRGRVARRAA